MTSYSVQLFGPFLLRAEGRPAQKPGAFQSQALLAYLLLGKEAKYRRPDLARLFWPDLPDQKAGQNLRQALSRLRRDLAGPDPFEGSAGWLSLDRTLFDVDALRFRALLDACADHPHRDPAACPPCCERLGRAMALYQGPLLSGLGEVGGDVFEQWLLLEREHFHVQVVESLRLLIRHHFSQRDYAQARDLSLRLRALEPYSEAAWLHLIRALFLLGDRAGALAQYERAEQALAEELGVAPGPPLQALYAQIRGGDAQPALAEPDLTPGQLHHFPMAFTSFVGRQAEMAQIVAGMADPACRVITVTGPVGMGKSRLVVEAARQINRLDFPDGLYFVPLSRDDPSPHATLTAALTQALALPEQPPQTLPRRLLQALAPKRLCLALDDFDPFMAEAAWVRSLLQAAPGVKLLITAQEALGLAGERRIALSGMGVEPAAPPADPLDDPGVRLFVQRAQRARPDFVPTPEDVAAIQGICRAMAGIPLAIEMAAAQVRVFECAAIAAQIPHQWDQLVHPWQDLPERHRSMRALFTAIWQQLTPREQQIFARCARFREGFDLSAAQSVTGATAADLAALVEKSLIAQDGEGRYIIHELLRLFGEERGG